VKKWIACCTMLSSLAACNQPDQNAAASSLDNAADALVNAQPLPEKLLDGTLTSAGLIAFVHAFQSYKPKDQFSPQQQDQSAVIGRKFHVVIPVASQADNGLWSYDTDKKALSFWFEPFDPANSTSNPSTVRLIPIDRQQDVGETKTMQNAFGATADVTRTTDTMIGVGSEALDYMGLFPKADRYQKYFTYGPLKKSIPMEPDKARQLTQDISLQIDGEVRKGTNTKSAVTCDEGGQQATVDNTSPKSWKACVVSVKLTHITIVSKAGGTLAEWGKAS
jgi:hypothetical protein